MSPTPTQSQIKALQALKAAVDAKFPEVKSGGVIDPPRAMGWPTNDWQAAAAACGDRLGPPKRGYVEKNGIQVGDGKHMVVLEYNGIVIFPH